MELWLLIYILIVSLGKTPKDQDFLLNIFMIDMAWHVFIYLFFVFYCIDVTKTPTLSRN